MGDQDQRTVIGGVQEIVHHRLGRHRIETGDRLVEDQHGELDEEGTGERQAAALPTGDRLPTLTDIGLETVREGVDPRPQSHSVDHGSNLVLGHVGIADPHVAEDRSPEEE